MISRLKQKATDAVESKDTAMENAQLDLSEVQAAHHDVKCELKDTLVKLHSCLQGYQQVKQGLRDQQQTYKSTLEAIHAQVDEREDYYLELERKYEHAARRGIMIVEYMWLKNGLISISVSFTFRMRSRL